MDVLLPILTFATNRTLGTKGKK
jgi:hypothetical protein